MLKFLKKMFHTHHFVIVTTKPVEIGFADAYALREISLRGHLVHRKCVVCDLNQYVVSTAKKDHHLTFTQYLYWKHK